MVNDSGQIYTIEGVAAGVLMLVTAYLVISTTTIITPQDVHIIDMQLQQLGNDALAMMDTADTYGNETTRNQSMLALTIAEPNVSRFNTTFLGYLDASTIIGTGSGNYAYNATIYYRDSTNSVKSYPFYQMPYYRENAVKVSRWVYLPNGTDHTSPITDLSDGNPHSVLLEVLIWRE